jgi:hypothetical protein
LQLRVVVGRTTRARRNLTDGLPTDGFKGVAEKCNAACESIAKQEMPWGEVAEENQK